MTERLWAPWRKAYILGKKSKKCFACVAVRTKNTRKTYLLEHSQFSFSILNIFPYNNGHVLVLPKKHVGELHQLSDSELLDLWKLVNRTMLCVQREMKPHGFNIGLNLGKAAGAGLPGHVHVHIVPRWKGDANFMPVVGKTKVISESLDSLHEKLRKGSQKK